MNDSLTNPVVLGQPSTPLAPGSANVNNEGFNILTMYTQTVLKMLQQAVEEIKRGINLVKQDQIANGNSNSSENDNNNNNINSSNQASGGGGGGGVDGSGDKKRNQSIDFNTKSSNVNSSSKRKEAANKGK